VDTGTSLRPPGPGFVGIAKREGNPFASQRGRAARPRRMRRRERRLGQERLPGAADVDEIVAVGAIAVEKHDELAGLACTRLEPRTVELCGHSPLHQAVGWTGAASRPLMAR